MIKKMMFILKQNDMILKGTSPTIQYKKDLMLDGVNHSVNASDKALTKILKELKGTKKITDKVIDKVNKIIVSEFEDIPKSMKSNLETNTANMYEYVKPTYKIKKAKGEDLETDLKTDIILDIDIDTISQLTTSDIVWIKHHSTNTQFGRNIAKAMEVAKLEGIDMDATAEILKKTFKVTTNKFIDMFGEKAYWKKVTSANTTRIKTYSNIRSLDEAGFKSYEWITQGEKACPICAPMNHKIFEVAHANKNIDNYLKAGAKGDVNGMKKADKWLTIEDVKANPDGIDGMLPQLHGKCYCIILGKR